MNLSQKTHYALLALLELASKPDQRPSIPQIAAARGIPEPFLQVILRQLRQGGLVDSQRGKAGGFTLARPAGTISLYEVVIFLEGEMTPLCHDAPCLRRGACALGAWWHEVQELVATRLRSTSLADLSAREASAGASRAGLPASSPFL